jgi:hypothetical protein
MTSARLALFLMADSLRRDLEGMLSTSTLFVQPDADFAEVPTSHAAIPLPQNLREIVEAMVPARMPNDVDILVSKDASDELSRALLALSDPVPGTDISLVFPKRVAFTHGKPKIEMQDRGAIEGEILATGEKFGALVGNVVNVPHELLGVIPVVNPLVMLRAKRKIFLEARAGNRNVDGVLADIKSIETFLLAFIVWFTRREVPNAGWSATIARGASASPDRSRLRRDPAREPARVPARPDACRSRDACLIRRETSDKAASVVLSSLASWLNSAAHRSRGSG